MRIYLSAYRKECLVIAMIVFIHSLRYFDYVNLNPTYYGWISNILSLLLIVFYCLFGRKQTLAYSRMFILGLIIVPMLSFIPCYLEHGQNPLISLRAYLSTFLVLVYFVLHAAKIKESNLVRVITIIAIARTLILLIQQFTYPSYLFSYRPEGYDVYGRLQEIEIRSGIYRYYIEDTYLAMFLVFYYLQKLVHQFNPIYLTFFFIGLFGVYLDQSRQFMISTLIAIVVPFLFVRNTRGKWLIISVFIVLGILGINYGYRFFSDLIQMTIDDLSDDTNIRLTSYATFLLEYWGGPLSVIFGNGPAGGGSAYGLEIQDMMESLRLYRADVGIVGALNVYGICSVLFLLYFYIAFVFRNWKELALHLKMYYIASLVNIPLVTIYTQNVNWFVFFAMMLYLSDLSIAKCKYVKSRRETDVSFQTI